MTIRIATVDDIPMLLEIERRCFNANQGQWVRRDFRRLITKGRGLFFVNIGYGRGYIYITPDGRILSIASDPDYVSIGHELLAMAEECCTGLHLEVRPSNKRAIRFYKKHGYVQYGRRAKYYKDGEDALLFRKGKTYVQFGDSL